MQPCRHAPSRLDRRAAGGSHGTDAEQAEKDAKQHHVPALRGDRQLKLQTPKKLQVQRSKHQTPNTREAPSFKFQVEARAAVWSLELGISLVFAAWFLVFRFRDFSGAWCLGFGVSFSHFLSPLRRERVF